MEMPPVSPPDLKTAQLSPSSSNLSGSSVIPRVNGSAATHPLRRPGTVLHASCALLPGASPVRGTGQLPPRYLPRAQVTRPNPAALASMSATRGCTVSPQGGHRSRRDPDAVCALTHLPGSVTSSSSSQITSNHHKPYGLQLGS